MRLGLLVLWAGLTIRLSVPLAAQEVPPEESPTAIDEQPISRLPPTDVTIASRPAGPAEARADYTGANASGRNAWWSPWFGPGDSPEAEGASDWQEWTVHGQTTIITDRHGPFRSPYIGPRSLLPIYEDATSQTSTLFLGRRLWQDAAIYFNPEVAGGRGFSGVNGIAGFPNAEITRVGKPQPTP